MAPKFVAFHFHLSSILLLVFSCQWRYRTLVIQCILHMHWRERMKVCILVAILLFRAIVILLCLGWLLLDDLLYTFSLSLIWGDLGLPFHPDLFIDVSIEHSRRPVYNRYRKVIWGCYIPVITLSITKSVCPGGIGGWIYWYNLWGIILNKILLTLITAYSCRVFFVYWDKNRSCQSFSQFSVSHIALHKSSSKVLQPLVDPFLVLYLF